jgi:hypothetical protein
MPLSPTDILQSFRLRFWHEPQEGSTGVWRGEVWHEQQEPGERAVPVVNPDEAFALVRHILHRRPEVGAPGRRRSAHGDDG